jgi:AraC-like DNA-binding protein
MGLTHTSSARPATPEDDGKITAQLLQTLAPGCDYDGIKLADRLNISLRHLHRIFAAIFAQTPREWLNRQRLVRARQMLLTAHSVKEVAFTLRFRGASQFSRDFRRQFGLIPSSLLGQGKELPQERRSAGTPRREPRLTNKNRPGVWSAA